MKRFVLLSLVKAFVISAGFYLISGVFGFVSNKPYQTSLKTEVIFFFLFFAISLTEYILRNRKK